MSLKPHVLYIIINLEFVNLSHNSISKIVFSILTFTEAKLCLSNFHEKSSVENELNELDEQENEFL